MPFDKQLSPSLPPSDQSLRESASIGERIAAIIAFSTLLRRLHNPKLRPEPLVWRQNLGLRGLTALPVSFGDT